MFTLLLAVLQLSLALTAHAAHLACTTWKVSTLDQLKVLKGATVRSYFISADIDPAWSFTPLRRDNCSLFSLVTNEKAEATWKKARYIQYQDGTFKVCSLGEGWTPERGNVCHHAL
jgi:hypothetical protein